MPKVIEWYRKPKNWLKNSLVIDDKQREIDDIGNEYNEWVKWLSGRNTLEDERKSEVLGAQSELKSGEQYASLLSTVRVRVFESGTEDSRFTLSNLVRESGTF